jgi:alpha-L-fucosidase
MQQAAHPWEESRGMGYSYGYNRNEKAEDYRTDRELLMMLIDIVSRGGNLLLDIGPTADGRIPVIMEERLLQLGDWLRPNAEAIYGTHARSVTRQWSAGTVPKLEVKEFMSEYPITALVDSPPTGNARVEAFFTAGKDAVYAILPRRPVGQVVLDGLEASGSVRVTLLEDGQSLQSTVAGRQVRVRVPAELSAALPARQAYVLKVAGAR